MSDSSSSDDEDVLNVYTDVSDDDGDTYSRGSTSEIEVGRLEKYPWLVHKFTFMT